MSRLQQSSRMVLRRPRHEAEHDEFEETRNSTLLTKNYKLLEWDDNLEMGSPNLFIPQQIADYVGSTPFCRYAISPRLDRVAIMNFNRELKVYSLEGDVMVQESSVQVLEDEFPEYCLLQFSECANLLLSTRSSAQIDVFDHSGGYCYDIPLDAQNLSLDLRSAVSCMQTEKNSSATADDKYLNWLYVLQYSGTFSAYKIGRLSRYVQMWTTPLNIGLASSFVLLKEYNLLLVGAHYPVKSQVKPVGGLCSFRLVDGAPHLDPIRTLQDNSGWLKNLPFTSSHYTFISSMTVSLAPHRKLIAVSTNGDLFVYDLPSTNASTVVKYISGPRPIQTTFVDENEVAVVFHDGSLLRCEPDRLQEAILELSNTENFDGRAEMVAPGARELFLLVEKAGSGQHREVVSERTFMAAQIWFCTIWSTLKSLIGMAVGDTPSPLQMAKHSDSFSFVLWYLPTRTLQQLLDRTLNDKDYTGAKKLADLYESINMNVILKREWQDVCDSDSVTVEAVTDILENIRDSSWVADAAATCSSTNLEAQRALARLGLQQDSAPTDIRVRLLHNARLLAASTDITFYLEHRGKSLLAIAFEFAKIGDLAGLQKLLEKNMDLLKPQILKILEMIPPAMSPIKYRGLLPLPNGDLCDVTESYDNNIRAVEDVLQKENPSLMFSVNFGEQGNGEGESNSLTWFRSRAIEIEEDTGLYSHSLELLEHGLENGFSELSSDISKWKKFISYVKMCSSINETFSRFNKLSLEAVVHNLAALTEKEILCQAENILALLGSLVEKESDLRRILRPLLTASSEKSTNVLNKFRQIRPDVLDKELITQCLSLTPLIGNDLITELKSFSDYDEVRSALLTLRDLGVKPTFKKMLDSTFDSAAARSILTQAIANMRATSPEEWESFKDGVMQLVDSHYKELVPRDEVLILLAKELLLNDALRTQTNLLNTLLTLNKTASKDVGHKLDQVKSAETLMYLSVDVMNQAVQKSDPNLDRSRFFATLARPIATKQAQEQLKLLDAVDIMYDLGSTIMPATIRLCDPMQILQQMIEIGTNYKKGKSLAKLATLLDIPTPVSTALSLAALAAIEHKDEECLVKYIIEIMKARDIPVVHKLCVQIIKSTYVTQTLEDIYSCALLNCPNDELDETLTLIEDSRKRRQVLIPSSPEPSTEIAIEPTCSTVNEYAKSDRKNRKKQLSENCRFALINLNSEVKPSEAACIWSRESASTAVVLSLLSEEEKAWTENDSLQRYQMALRHFMPKLTAKMVENIPPRILIDSFKRLAGTDSPLDRIELQGVDRSRFIADAAYREESLDGLAMTEDDNVFIDALELAKQFQVDDWQLHMTSLENALTSCSPAEAKRILKTRGHLAKLKTDLIKFHSSLRSKVLPLIDTNEMFIAYLSLFAEDQPEKMASPTLKKILEKKKDLSAKKLFTDSNYLTEIIISMPDKFITVLAEGLRKYLVGVNSCDSAAKTLLNGTNIRPPASVIAISTLLGNDETACLELIASKSLEEEIQYLQQAEIILEATPGAPANLSTAIKDRLALLTAPTNGAASNEPEKPSFVLTSRRRN